MVGQPLGAFVMLIRRAALLHELTILLLVSSTRTANYSVDVDASHCRYLLSFSAMVNTSCLACHMFCHMSCLVN